MTAWTLLIPVTRVAWRQMPTLRRLGPGSGPAGNGRGPTGAGSRVGPDLFVPASRWRPCSAPYSWASSTMTIRETLLTAFLAEIVEAG
jgi:hypothetical protein